MESTNQEAYDHKSVMDVAGFGRILCVRLTQTDEYRRQYERIHIRILQCWRRVFRGFIKLFLFLENQTILRETTRPARSHNIIETKVRDGRTDGTSGGRRLPNRVIVLSQLSELTASVQRVDYGPRANEPSGVCRGKGHSSRMESYPKRRNKNKPHGDA